MFNFCLYCYFGDDVLNDFESNRYDEEILDIEVHTGSMWKFDKF